jgi:peptidoglycan LD-endopeptidase LytH
MKDKRLFAIFAGMLIAACVVIVLLWRFGPSADAQTQSQHLNIDQEGVQPTPAVHAHNMRTAQITQPQVSRPGIIAPRRDPIPPQLHPAKPPEDMMDAVVILRHRNLQIPLDDVKADQLRDSFEESRGNHVHEAMDILAPRNTPIHAVEDGTIAKLWTSVAGGLTIYQFDPDKQYEYYYAHLEKYAAGLKEGDVVQRGQIIGYVGTSGNAPKNTPHLHFTIFELTEQKHWWEGRAINPYWVFTNRFEG